MVRLDSQCAKGVGSGNARCRRSRPTGASVRKSMKHMMVTQTQIGPPPHSREFLSIKFKE